MVGNGPSMCVKHLMVHGLKIWDVAKVRQICHPLDAASILETPLFHSVKDDLQVWKFSKDGIGSYSVRSGYRLVMERLLVEAQNRVEGDWQVIWRLSNPPK